MSEANGNSVEAGSVGEVVTGANRLPKPKKPAAAKGSAMGFYEAMRKTVAKKKTLTLTADTEEAKVTLSVKAFPSLSAAAITAAAAGGVDASFKLKGGIEGKDATAKGTYEGEHGSKMAEEFFGIDTADKD